MLKVDVTYDQSQKGRSFQAEELTQQLFEQSMSFSTWFLFWILRDLFSLASWVSAVFLVLEVIG